MENDMLGKLENLVHDDFFIRSWEDVRTHLCQILHLVRDYKEVRVILLEGALQVV